ncbi:MAG TPA: hypothetical protein VGD19_04970 [Allosphingosinicella sp.]|jgi:hypothetical protein
MNKAMTAILVAGTIGLGACTTYDDRAGYNDDSTLRGAATGAAIGAVGGAAAGAVIPGVSPVEGAVAGAVVGGVAGAIAADNDRDGYPDDQYYDRNGDGYYDERYDANGRPMPVRYPPPPPPVYRSGERG